MGNKENIDLINARMNEISDMISEMNRKYKELEKERFHLIASEISSVVGMCLKTDEEVIRIIGVPQVEWDNNCRLYYSYKLPCLVVTNENEVYTDFLDYGRSSDAIEYLRSNYEEITNDEFDKRLMEAFEWMRELGIKRPDA